MEIITGYTGTPHITAAQDRAENQGTFGTGSYVLNVGSKLAATAISANEVQIADGVLSHQGCLAIIANGSYDSLPIANGSQGMNRIDLIVARYTKDSGTNVESMSLAVIQGTATSSTPSAPSYNNGDIQNGDTPVDMPLYQVRLTGISLTSITPVFTAVQTQSETDTLLNTVNTRTTTTAGTFSKIASVTLNVNTKLHKTGDTVVFNIDATTSANIPSGSGSAGFITFPSGYRPATSIEFLGIDATNSVVKGFWVTANGQIQVAISAIPANAVFRVSGSFSIS